MPKPKKHTEVIKEKYGDDKDRFVLHREGKKGQPNLFGDQDFVFNAIQEEMSGIHVAIERANDSIDNQKKKLIDLHRRKQQLDKAAVIVRGSKHLLKPGDAKKKESEEEEPF